MRGVKCEVFHRFGGPAEYSLSVISVIITFDYFVKRHCMYAVLAMEVKALGVAL